MTDYRNKNKGAYDPNAKDVQLPYNEESERFIISTLLVNPDYYNTFSIKLKPEQFFIETWRKCYGIISNLIQGNKVVSHTVVWDKMERDGIAKDLYPDGYLTFLKDTDTGPYSLGWHIATHAQIVERSYLLRQIIQIAGQMARFAHGTDGPIPDSPDEIIGKVQDLVSPILISTSDRIRPTSVVVNEVLDKIEWRRQNPGAMLGIPTGLKDVDEMFLGLQETDLVILAGRPGTGKTSLALTIILNAIKKAKKKVGMISLEMSDMQLVERLLAAESGVSGKKLKTGKMSDDEFSELYKACKELANDGYLFIDDAPGLSAQTMRSRINRLVLKNNIDLLVVDYMQLIGSDNLRGGDASRVQEVSYISRTLKNLARGLRIPILALSQLSREVEKRKDKRPIASDLKESGSIEQDADVIWMLFLKSLYEETDTPNLAELICPKHRGGETGTLMLYFDKERFNYKSLEKRKLALPNGLPAKT